MGKVRPALLLVAFGIVTPMAMVVQRVLLATSPEGARQFPKFYHRSILRLFGIRVRHVGTPITTGPTLIVTNHVSWLDIPVVSSLYPVSFVAKREVGTWPFFGTLARLQRSVFVDRDRRHSAGTSRDEMGERLDAGDTLVLFPEGTSSDGNGILPFKTAFFGAAVHAGVAVQPMAIAYRGHRGLPMGRRFRPFYAWYGDMDLAPHLWGAIAAGPIEITVVTLDPIPYDPTVDRKSLAARCEDLIRRALIQALHAPDKMS
jgi:1-acyl-sn-glycerol-3-phosphate acyltransferase